jgi:hypothetical protein
VRVDLVQQIRVTLVVKGIMERNMVEVAEAAQALLVTLVHLPKVAMVAMDCPHPLQVPLF